MHFRVSISRIPLPRVYSLSSLVVVKFLKFHCLNTYIIFVTEVLEQKLSFNQKGFNTVGQRIDQVFK